MNLLFEGPAPKGQSRRRRPLLLAALESVESPAVELASN